jgi:hypothetical protein
VPRRQPLVVASWEITKTAFGKAATGWHICHQANSILIGGFLLALVIERLYRIDLHRATLSSNVPCRDLATPRLNTTLAKSRRNCLQTTIF